jgi:N-acetylglucosaminyl-diphospho-decaprenol L-rhamnosyltransferase
MVTFRGGEAVAGALDALATARERLDGDRELLAVVVDNASGDGTVDRVHRHAPWAQVVELPANVGFARGCNVGIERCREAEVIVLLNPDVEVGAGFLRGVLELAWPSDVAARGPAIRDAAGGLEQSARGFPRARTGLLGRTSLLARLRPHSRLLRGELRADAKAGAREVDWVSGACMIVPAERFASLGGLDEGYFMYWEDADWCHRAHERGYSVIYEPTLVVTHHQGSSSRYRSGSTTIYFHRSALRFWRRNVARSPLSTALVAVALTVRCMLKLAALCVRRLAPQRRAWRAAR